MTEQIKISIRQLNFFYDKTQALYDLSLDVRDKQILTVFGPAGSGTTTLMRTLNRMCDLTAGARVEGEILMDGRDIYKPDINVTELRRRIGMVFEIPVPLPMTVFDNVAYGLRLTGKKSRSELLGIVEESLRLSALWDEVKDRLDLPATSLSGGQQQRLCIARVLALQSEVILLDRPCAALDPISTSMIEDSLQHLKERLAVIIVPHNVAQASRISDRAAFLLMGQLLEEGPTEELFANPKQQQTSDYITGRFG